MSVLFGGQKELEEVNFSLPKKMSMFSFILKRYLDRASICFSYDPKLCSSNLDLSPKFKIYFD